MINCGAVRWAALFKFKIFNLKIANGIMNKDQVTIAETVHS